MNGSSSNNSYGVRSKIRNGNSVGNKRNSSIVKSNSKENNMNRDNKKEIYKTNNTNIKTSYNNCKIKG